MLCLCYLFLVMGTPDYTHGPVRLCHRVVVDGVRDDSDTVNLLTHAARIKAIPINRYHSPAVSLCATQRFVNPILTKYYDDPQGTMFCIQPQDGFRLLYIYTPDNFSSVPQMVSALNRQFLKLIDELAKALDSGTRVNEGITKNVFNAMCEIIAPGDQSLKYTESSSTTSSSVFTRQDAEEKLGKNSENKTCEETWQSQQQKTQRPTTPPMSSYEDKRTSGKPQPKTQHKASFPIPETVTHTSHSPPPAQSTAAASAYSFSSPLAEDGESKETKELRLKALRLAKRIEQQKAIDDEQSARKDLMESADIFANMKKEEFTERLKLFERLADRIMDKFAEDQKTAFQDLRGAFLYERFNIRYEAEKANALHLQKLKNDFEASKALARQDLLDNALLKGQEIQKAYDQIVQSIQEALQDRITETDPMLVLWPDGWHLPYEYAYKSKGVLRTRYYLLREAQIEKRSAVPTAFYRGLCSIYDENLLSMETAYNKLLAEINTFENELDKQKIPHGQTTEWAFSVLQVDQTTYNLLVPHQKLTFLEDQKNRLINYWTQYEALSKNPYKTELQEIIFNNISWINIAYQDLKTPLLVLLNWQTNQDIIKISAYYKINIKNYSSVFEFQQACRPLYKEKALKLHPDKGGNEALFKELQEMADLLESIVEKSKK